MRDLIVDAHLDLGWNALQWNRDLTQSVYTLRTHEAALPGRGQNTVALPELRAGKIYLCVATLMGRSTGTPSAHVDFHSAMQAHGISRGQLAYYRALEHHGYVTIITTLQALDAHLQLIAELPDDPKPAPIGFVISMESADAILEPAEVGEWYALGVRAIGPAHYGMGRYAGGTGVEDGFTDIGFQLLDEMQQHNMILDLTHLTDVGFWQALEKFDGTVIASHNNCRALVPSQRQFSDEQIRAIAERGGVVGMAFDVWMMQAGYIKGYTSNKDIPLSRIIEHIDHICQLTGNAQHVGIGSDLDGGYGREQSPHDLDTIADLQHLIPLLQQCGYAQADIDCILHDNWIRILRTTWA
ncbi:MAG: membrane dipeptidase [Aggregatilineales bacterium]